MHRRYPLDKGEAARAYAWLLKEGLIEEAKIECSVFNGKIAALTEKGLKLTDGSFKEAYQRLKKFNDGGK